MPEIKQYTADDQAAKLLAQHLKLSDPEGDALEASQVSGTIGTLDTLYEKRKAGDEINELANDTDEEKESFDRLMAQIDEDIKEDEAIVAN